MSFEFLVDIVCLSSLVIYFFPDSFIYILSLPFYCFSSYFFLLFCIDSFFIPPAFLFSFPALLHFSPIPFLILKGVKCTAKFYYCKFIFISNNCLYIIFNNSFSFCMILGLDLFGAEAFKLKK